MFQGNISGNTNNQKSRRKRKKQYFGVREERAVRMFLTASTFSEKNEIYNDFLKDPINKMVESIIRKYKLYRKGMDFTQIHTDTLSFLITKVDRFKPSRNKKAYSYFGTICKNYLMSEIIKDQKDQNRKISYEDITSKIENRPDMIYYIENEKIETNEIIEKFIKELTEFMENNQLNNSEIRVGYALIELFENYDVIFKDNIFVGNNNKFNKNVILHSLREMTNMTTKEIRNSMKKYKKLYYVLLKELYK